MYTFNGSLHSIQHIYIYTVFFLLFVVVSLHIMLCIVCFHDRVHKYLLIRKTLTVAMWNSCITTLKSDILIAEKMSNLSWELDIFCPNKTVMSLLIPLVSVYQINDEISLLNNDNG